MSPVTNTKVIFAKVPTGFPVLGETLKVVTESLDVESLDLPASTIVLKTLALSLDPYMRGRLRDASIESYSPAFALDQPITNFAVSLVVRAGPDAKFSVGQKVYGFSQFASYAVLPVEYQAGLRLIENSEKLPWTAWVGAAGMPGKTAAYSWWEIANAKKGEKVFVSSAYGPVGSLICQLAKESGCEVIASAGSDKKVAYLKEKLGVDRAFNYKSSSTEGELKAFGPIDIYFDNVGSATLDAALGAMARTGGRIIECGMISGYNGQEPYAFKNIMQIIGKGITMRGFLVSMFEDKYAERFYKEIPAKFGSGSYIFNEHVVEGLENVPQALLDMLHGNNDGKVVIKVADE